MSVLVRCVRRPWNPRRITSIAWDYDPRQCGLADGAQVATLTDVSGNARHATQSTAARRPIFVADALNGHPGISFTAASQQYLRTATFGTPIAQPQTVFLLAKALSGGAARPFFHGISAPNTQFLQITAGDLWSASAGTALNGPARTSDYEVVTLVINGASSRLRVSGVESSGNMGSQSLGGLTIGGNAALTQFLSGTIVRFFAYNKVCSATEIARCERFLNKLADTTQPWGATVPASRFIFQRSGGATTDLVIEGTWDLGAPEPTGIEVNYKSAGWADIGATFAADGTWSGTLSAQADGQGTLEVRQTNDPSDTRTYLLVGVGDVFVVAGQSNAVGRFTNMQTYSHATLKPAVYRENSTVPDDLVDPTDSDVIWGSVYPPLATLIMADQSVPVMFITTATGSTGLVDADDWKVNRDRYLNCVARVRASGVNALKAILWYQGEDDAGNDVTAADYKAELSRMLDGFQLDFELWDNDGALASDTFTAADGTTLSGRTPTTGPANWVTRAGALQITSNKAVPAAVAETTGAIATMDLGETDVRFRATIQVGSSGLNGFVFRYDVATGEHYAASWGPNGMRVHFYDGESYNQVASDTTAIASSTDLEVMAGCNGKVIVMRYGETVLRYINATENPTADHHGIRFSPAMLGSIDSLVATTMDGPVLVCAQIGERNETTGTDAIRTAQAEIPDEDPDIFAGPLTYDMAHADGLHHTTDAEATKLSNRWWRAIDDAVYGGTNGTGPRFVSAATVDSTHIDVTFSFPGSATSMAVGASPTIGWEVMDSGVERTVSAVALQSATVLRLTLGAAMTGTVTISFGKANDASGTTIADNHTYPLPPVPFLDQAVS